MIKKLKFVRPALFAALLCGVSAVPALAQEPAPPANPGSQPPPPAHHGPPPTPLFDALDTNHDGTISADEITNASASLKGLLKNGADHLTRDDLRPAGAPPPPPPHAVPAPGNRPAGDDQDGPPRFRGGPRPHQPPHGPENVGPGHEQAGGNFDRPRFHREEQREARREMRRDFRGHDEDMADERPFPRRERMARRQGPHHPEGDDMDHDARPPHQGEANHGGPLAQHGPPPMPLFDALDANHDGTLSADEISNASASLKGLLKNGSDHFTRDDLQPAGDRPPMGH